MQTATLPFEQQKIFTLFDPGDARQRRTFKEVPMSVSQLIEWRQDGRLTGDEHVRCPGDSRYSRLDTVLQKAAAGLLSAPVAEAAPLKPAVKITKQDVETAYQECARSGDELDKLKRLAAQQSRFEDAPAARRKFMESPGDELHRLETSGDLADSKVLTRISELRVMTATLPHRSELARQLHGRNQRRLLDVCNSFITDTFGPRLSEMDSRTRALLTAKFKDLIAPEELEHTLNGSELIRRLNVIREPVIVRGAETDEAMEVARRLLSSWTAADEFEKKHLST
ncbi:MAG TPA: hypothetical protein VFE51_20095 [Verrucomicrobiae bacterium]|nr:hypothetical protein [Verrucomicrobiae bacterium]